MAPPGAQPYLADDATFDPRGHSRYNSTATQATLVADVAQPGANALDRALKGTNSNDGIRVVDNQRFRVTAGTPSGPNAVATTANTGSSTAAAPKHIPSLTAAALAVAEPTTTATAAGPNEGPSGGNVAGVADGDGYEDSSDDEFDYDQLDYENVFSLPPGCKKIRIPIGQTGPNDVVDQNGRAWRVVRIDDVPPVGATQDVDEEDDWVLSGGADNDSANANGDDNEDERVNDNGNNGDNEDEDGGNDSDLDPEWQPPAELPKGPDAAGTIGLKDVRTEANRERVARETVAVSKVAPTVPLPPNFVRVPLRPEPDNILRPPWWDEELEKHIAAPLAPPDDAPPVPLAAKRKRDEEEDEDDEPAPRAPKKKARRGKPLDVDELCARLAVIAWIIDVCGTCARLTDGRRDLFAGANADDAEGDAGADVDGPHNSENGSEAGAADEHDEDSDWVLQP